MIAVDLDDTLLRSDLSISFFTQSVIKKAAASGVTMVIASGRTYNALAPFAAKLAMQKSKGFLVCENGALIQESDTGTLVEQSFIPVKTAMTAYKLADAEDFSVQKYDGKTIYISRKNEFSDYDIKLTGMRQIVVDDFRTVVEEGCHKLLIPGDPVTLRPFEDILKAYIGDEATIFTSKPYFLEILPPNTDKGTALARIAQRLNINRDEVMAFGDSMNDEAMIKWAGCGVAMINGDARIKKAARMVTEKDNNDDGVAHFISRYVLKGEALP
jgi:Cof subfamily protein (haloacid dehalogenase superfamily)